MTSETTPEPQPTTPARVPIIRCGLGGVLMGLANLVPGISGGTMLVACGIYTLFIDAVSDATRLRFNRRMLLVLACVMIGAAAAIGGLASMIHFALVHHPWVMFSLFIGLTLGGVPILLRMARPVRADTWRGIVIGAVLMAGLVVVQETGQGGGGMTGTLGFIVGGAAAAGAMILPGISGAFLLLLLGMYEPIIGAIKDTIAALRSADAAAVIDQMAVIVPVGIGVLLGVALISNALRWVLHHHERITLGVLLGLIIAAPAGLYPFRVGIPPEIGDTIKGEVVTPETVEEWRAPDNAKDWAQRAFTPNPGQIAGSLGLIGVGFAATLGIARLGREEEKAKSEERTTEHTEHTEGKSEKRG